MSAGTGQGSERLPGPAGAVAPSRAARGGGWGAPAKRGPCPCSVLSPPARRQRPALPGREHVRGVREGPGRARPAQGLPAGAHLHRGPAAAGGREREAGGWRSLRCALSGGSAQGVLSWAPGHRQALVRLRVARQAPSSPEVAEQRVQPRPALPRVGVAPATWVSRSLLSCFNS